MTVAGYVALAGIAIFALKWLVGAGRNKERVKTLEDEAEGRDEADERGEDWDRRGGLADLARDRLSDDADSE